MTPDFDVLEKEIQRVFKQLGSICCDVQSHIWIIQILCNAYKECAGHPLSIDY